MPAQPTTTWTPIEGLTQEEIQQLIDDRTAEGASSCQVLTDGGRKFLVTQWPPPKLGG